MQKALVVLAVLTVAGLGAAVSWYANDGFWFALAIGFIVIVGLAG